MASRATNPIQSTKTSFRLLDEIAERDAPTLGELTDAVDLSQGAVYNHLATLSELGVITQADSGYRLNHRLLRYVAPLQQSNRGIVTARDKLRELADTTGEFASLVVHDGDSMIVVDTAAGDLATADLRTLGEAIPVHLTAGGRAVLSAMAEEEAERICRKIASAEAVEEADLVDEVKTARAQGIAFSRGEHQGEYSVAAPVDVKGEDQLFALCVTGPGDRLSGKALQQDVAGLVVRAASISNNRR